MMDYASYDSRTSVDMGVQFLSYLWGMNAAFVLNAGLPTLIVAPSGAGKTTLVKSFGFNQALVDGDTLVDWPSEPFFWKKFPDDRLFNEDWIRLTKIVDITLSNKQITLYAPRPDVVDRFLEVFKAMFISGEHSDGFLKNNQNYLRVAFWLPSNERLKDNLAKRKGSLQSDLSDFDPSVRERYMHVAEKHHVYVIQDDTLDGYLNVMPTRSPIKTSSQGLKDTILCCQGDDSMVWKPWGPGFTSPDAIARRNILLCVATSSGTACDVEDSKVTGHESEEEIPDLEDPQSLDTFY